MKRKLLAVTTIIVFTFGLYACGKNTENPSTAPTETNASVAENLTTEKVTEEITEAPTTTNESGNTQTTEDKKHIETAKAVSYRPVDDDVEWGVTVQYDVNGAEVLCNCPPSTMVSGLYKSGKVSGKADTCEAFELGGYDIDQAGAILEMEAHLNGDYLTLTIVEPDKPENVKYWAKELKFIRE